MPSKHDPTGCFADIIENLERIEGYVSGMDQDTFASNNMLRDAVERCLERVCEAAHRLGDRGPELMPSHPGGTSAAWATGCGTLMTGISPEVLWNVACDDLPALRRDARVALDAVRPAKP